VHVHQRLLAVGRVAAGLDLEPGLAGLAAQLARQRGVGLQRAVRQSLQPRLLRVLHQLLQRPERGQVALRRRRAGRLHPRADALVPRDEPLLAELAHGLAQRVARNAEALAQLRLGWQQRAHRVAAVADLAREHGTQLLVTRRAVGGE